MTNEAPAKNDDVWTLTGTLVGTGENVSVIVIPRDEWLAHKGRVEALVNMINSVVNGMAESPILMSMLPPETLAEMRRMIP